MNACQLAPRFEMSTSGCPSQNLAEMLDERVAANEEGRQFTAAEPSLTFERLPATSRRKSPYIPPAPQVCFRCLH